MNFQAFYAGMPKNRAPKKMSKGERISTGERIKAFRVWLKMTQSEFAAELGLKSHTSIINFEKHGILPQRNIVRLIVELAEREGYPHITREMLREMLFED